jgi:hypothetical protein
VSIRITRRQVLFALAAAPLAAAAPPDLEVRPAEYPEALRNPLMGFRPNPDRARNHRWATLARDYVKWNEIETSAADGVDQVRAVSAARWARLADLNIKVIPRVFLDYPKRGKYWPADMTEGDYSSSQFKERVTRLVGKMGQAWDNDPRVAFMEMGLIGFWGEHHSPRPDKDMQKLLGDAFRSAFRNKLVMVRYPKDFTDCQFGIHWDSFGHPQEEKSHIPLLESPPMAGRWRIAPMGGETAFDWGTPLGKSPTDAVMHNSDRVVSLIRRLHWNHLGWLSDYDEKDEVASRNGALIQKAFGYRFVLDSARYPAVVTPGRRFRFSFSVRNTGSTPLYYNWPVEVSLLDPATREPRWKSTVPDLDVRRWLPGDNQTYTAGGEFQCPRTLKKGSYVLAIAILDPAGNLPSARFSIVNYFRGGRHPLGLIGVGMRPDSAEVSGFDDPGQDRSLGYAAS